MGDAATWYESSTFWAVAAVVVALILGIATIVATYRVGFPRRRLFYGMPTVTPLLSASASLSSDLELRHRGNVLTDPQVVELWLVSRGRRDISSSSYDRDQPIRLDVAVPIAQLLRQTSNSSSIPEREARIDGTTLAVGPGLLGRRHRITYTLLVDGTPRLTARCALTDVQVRRSDDLEFLTRSFIRRRRDDISTAAFVMSILLAGTAILWDRLYLLLPAGVLVSLGWILASISMFKLITGPSGRS